MYSLYTLAATLPGSDVAKDIIAKTNSDLALIFVCFLIVAVTLGLVHMKWVSIPDRKLAREQKEESAKAAAELVKATATMAPILVEARDHSAATREHILAVRRMMEAGIRALEKLNRGADVDLAAEIGEMKGALGTLEHGSL